MAPKTEELERAVVEPLGKANEIAELAKSEGRDFTPDEQKAISDLLDASEKALPALKALGDGEKIRERLASLGDSVGLNESPFRVHGDKSKGADDELALGRLLSQQKSVGSAYAESSAFKAWLAQMAPMGEIPEGLKGFHTPGMVMPFGLKGIESLSKANVISSGGADPAAGTPGGAQILVRQQWLGLIDDGTFRKPLNLRNLISVGTTTSDSVGWARENAFTNAAAFVAEATTTTGSGASGGVKPQSDFDYVMQEAAVKTVAHWVAATKRALADVGQLRTIIDNLLAYGLDEKVENEIVNGNGGLGWTGLVNETGLTPQAWATDFATTTLQARNKVRTVGRAVPTAYLMNPADAEIMALLRDNSSGANTGPYIFGGPAQTGAPNMSLWRLPVVESEFVPAGTGYVGDFRRIQLWDRERTAISATDSHSDFFVRNLVAILAELRAAFAIIRPSAIVEIDLTA